MQREKNNWHQRPDDDDQLQVTRSSPHVMLKCVVGHLMCQRAELAPSEGSDEHFDFCPVYMTLPTSVRESCCFFQLVPDGCETPVFYVYPVPGGNHVTEGTWHVLCHLVLCPGSSQSAPNKKIVVSALATSTFHAHAHTKSHGSGSSSSTARTTWESRKGERLGSSSGSKRSPAHTQSAQPASKKKG